MTTVVRRATVGDTKQVLDFLEEYHKESNMSGIKFVRTDCAKIVDYFIRASDTYASIAVKEDTGELVGLLFGELQPFFFNAKKTWASDTFFISKGAGPTLLRKWKEWAFGMGADRIIMGVSSGDERADSLLELTGFERTGGMYLCLS